MIAIDTSILIDLLGDGAGADAAAAGSAAATSVMVPGACACSGAVAQLHSSATQAAASTVNGEIGRF